MCFKHQLLFERRNVFREIWDEPDRPDEGLEEWQQTRRKQVLFCQASDDHFTTKVMGPLRIDERVDGTEDQHSLLRPKAGSEKTP